MADGLKLEDSINYLDGNYEAMVADPKFSASKLRSRPTSFASIRGYWDKYLLNALSELQNDLVNAEYPVDEDGKLHDSAEKELDKIVSKIAGLENVLIHDISDVPKDYVGKKAIKLKAAMISRLVKKAEGIYAIPVDQTNDVLEDAKLTDNAGNELGYSLADTSEQLSEITKNEEFDTEDQKEIAESVDDAFAQITPSKEEVENSVVSPEVVEEAVNESFNDLDTNKDVEEEKAEEVDSETEVGDIKIPSETDISARMAEFDSEGVRKDESDSPVEEELVESEDDFELPEIPKTFDNVFEMNTGDSEVVSSGNLVVDDYSDTEGSYDINGAIAEYERLKEELVRQAQREKELSKRRAEEDERGDRVNNSLKQTIEKANMSQEELDSRLAELRKQVSAAVSNNDQFESRINDDARITDNNEKEIARYQEIIRDNASLSGQIDALMFQSYDDGSEELGRVR